MDDTWLDRSAYPFAPHHLAVDGGRMHYVDEGRGEPILLVHGTPVWSFLYRRFIAGLAGEHRVIAPDHIGFGLSDKPPAWGYSFEAHSRNLAALVERLDLRDLTLVVHDLGGPIGLRLAIEQPWRVRRLVICNTLLWPMAGAFAPPALAALLGGPVGRFLYLRMNLSARSLLPIVYADRSKLTPAIHRQYLAPFPTPDDRHGMFAFAQRIAAGVPELAELWARRAALAEKPALLIWGMRDPAFPPKFLGPWRELFPAAELLELPNAGHFIQEEAPDLALGAIRRFIGAPAPVGA